MTPERIERLTCLLAAVYGPGDGWPFHLARRVLREVITDVHHHVRDDWRAGRITRDDIVADLAWLADAGLLKAHAPAPHISGQVEASWSFGANGWPGDMGKRPWLESLVTRTITAGEV